MIGNWVEVLNYDATEGWRRVGTWPRKACATCCVFFGGERAERAVEAAAAASVAYAVWFSFVADSDSAK